MLPTLARRASGLASGVFHQLIRVQSIARRLRARRQTAKMMQIERKMMLAMPGTVQGQSGQYEYYEDDNFDHSSRRMVATFTVSNNGQEWKLDGEPVPFNRLGNAQRGGKGANSGSGSEQKLGAMYGVKTKEEAGDSEGSEGDDESSSEHSDDDEQLRVKLPRIKGGLEEEQAATNPSVERRRRKQRELRELRRKQEQELEEARVRLKASETAAQQLQAQAEKTNAELQVERSARAAEAAQARAAEAAQAAAEEQQLAAEERELREKQQKELLETRSRLHASEAAAQQLRAQAEKAEKELQEEQSARTVEKARAEAEMVRVRAEAEAAIGAAKAQAEGEQARARAAEAAFNRSAVSAARLRAAQSQVIRRQRSLRALDHTGFAVLG